MSNLFAVQNYTSSDLLSRDNQQVMPNQEYFMQGSKSERILATLIQHGKSQSLKYSDFF